MKTINVLMLQPKTPQSFWSHDNSLKAAGFKTVMPPLGLMTVAAMLPDNYNVTLIDLNVQDLDLRDVDRSDLVFLTGMSVHRGSFIEMINICHDRGKTIIAGGPFIQSMYGLMGSDNAEIDKINHIILYEAESNLPQFLQDYEQGKAKKIYDNREKPDLTMTPPPRFDLIRTGDYASMSLQFSRGCPFNCEFCDIVQMFGHVPRTKTAAQFMHEIETLYATGYRGRLFIVDDNLTANRKAVKEMLRSLAAWQEARGYPFILFTEVSIDLVRDDDLLHLMVRSGFTSVFIGIESPDTVTLRAVNKNMNVVNDMSTAIEKIQRAGMEVMGGFILGFDTDTEDIFDRQLDFISRNGIVQSMVGVLNAMPHTELYKRLEREGRLINIQGKGLHSGDNVSAELNFIPRMPKEKLVAGFMYVIAETYKPRNYFSRSFILLSRLPHMKISALLHTEPWIRKLSVAKFTMHPNKIKLAVEFIKLCFSSYGIRGLIFIIRSLQFGVLTLPVSIELTFRGLHYINVSKRIQKQLYEADC